MVHKEIEVARNFIDGAFVDGMDQTWSVALDPFTGLQRTRSPKSGLLDLATLICSMNQLWAHWSKVPGSGRAELLNLFAEKIAAQATRLAEIESSETGLAASGRIECLQTAVASLRADATWASGPANQPAASGPANQPAASGPANQPAASGPANQPAASGPANQPAAAGEFFEVHRPLGTVAAITSWTEAGAEMVIRIGSALATGNVLLIKPSSKAPRTAMTIAQLWSEAFSEWKSLGSAPAALNAGVLGVLFGAGREIGESIVQHPGITAISFTGTTENGRSVLSLASELCKRTQLAMSGNGAILIFAGCDLALAAERVWQLALSADTPVAWRATRVFVQESIAKAWQSAFVEFAAKPESIAASWTVMPQEYGDRFWQAVEQAKNDKGKVLFGAKPGAGNRVEATAFADFTNCSVLHRQEVVGPLVLLNTFKYQFDGIKLANATNLPRVVYILHPDRQTAIGLAPQLEAETIVIDQVAPWTVLRNLSRNGLKESGMGSWGGEAGRRFFSSLRSVSLGSHGDPQPVV